MSGGAARVARPQISSTRKEAELANPENLIPNDQRTPSQRRENARKAGKASGKARRERKQMREVIEELMSRQYVDANGNEIDGVTALMTRVYRQAMDGDMKAVTFLRDTAGEMPVQKVETVTIAPETYERVQGILDSFSSGCDTDVQPTEED